MSFFLSCLSVLMHCIFKHASLWNNLQAGLNKSSHPFTHDKWNLGWKAEISVEFFPLSDSWQMFNGKWYLVCMLRKCDIWHWYWTFSSYILPVIRSKDFIPSIIKMRPLFSKKCIFGGLYIFNIALIGSRISYFEISVSNLCDWLWIVTSDMYPTSWEALM